MKKSGFELEANGSIKDDKAVNGTPRECVVKATEKSAEIAVRSQTSQPSKKY